MITVEPHFEESIQVEEARDAMRFALLMKLCTKASVRASKEDGLVKQIVIEFTKKGEDTPPSSEFFRHDLTQAIDEMLGVS